MINIENLVYLYPLKAEEMGDGDRAIKGFVKWLSKKYELVEIGECDDPNFIFE